MHAYIVLFQKGIAKVCVDTTRITVYFSSNVLLF